MFQPVRVVAGYFQRNQVKGVVVPVLSAKTTISEERTTGNHSPTRQAMAEGVDRFIDRFASRSEIPSGNGLLLKVYRDIKPSGDNKPSCHPKAEVSIRTIGYSKRTSEQQRHIVQVICV